MSMDWFSLSEFSPCFTLFSFQTLDHVSVSLIGSGEEMRRHLVSSLSHVVLDDGLGVDGKTLVGVDYNTEETGIGLNS